MLIEINEGELVIISEDAMDVAYLETLFNLEGQTIRIVKEINFVYCGFRVTDQREVRIKLTKAEE